MPVVLNLDEINTENVLADIHKCMNPDPIPGDMIVDHPVLHVVESAEIPPPPPTFAGFGNQSRGKQIGLLKKTFVQADDMDSDDDDVFRTVPMTAQPTKRKSSRNTKDSEPVKKVKLPPKKKGKVDAQHKLPVPTNQDGEVPCTSAQAIAAQQNSLPKAPKNAQATLCQFENMQNVFKGNTACADTCKTPIAREPEISSGDVPDTLRPLPRQRLTARRRNPQPIRLRCNIPFQQDLEYVHAYYPGYGSAVMLREVYGENMICLSFDMMREIIRQSNDN